MAVLTNAVDPKHSSDGLGSGSLDRKRVDGHPVLILERPKGGRAGKIRKGFGRHISRNGGSLGSLDCGPFIRSGFRHGHGSDGGAGSYGRSTRDEGLAGSGICGHGGLW